MPMDRCAHRAFIEKVDDDVLPLAQPHQRTWHRAVDGHSRAEAIAGGEPGIGNGHGQVFAGQNITTFASQRPFVTAGRPGRY